MDKTGYADHRLDMAKRQRERRSLLGDVGEIPKPRDPERRERCRNDLRAFCETYRPAAFFLGWSEDHLRVIDRVSATVIDGGLFGLAMPRGSGKTTVVVTSALWALCYGHRKWVCLLGATQPKAVSLVRAIKTELRFNELLAADFPEVAIPVRALEGRAARAGSQTYHGEPTHISWSVDAITLPTIAGSASSGARVTACGITGDIRGQQETLADGCVVRPDYVLLDDPQTRESARSSTQTQDRLAVLNGDILGLAGPGVKISGVMPCTVISRGDMADQILDRELNPAWHGERTKLLYGMPENMTLWEQYNKILEADLRNGGNGSLATQFYGEHREEMDRGARAAWECRHNEDELSGVQHAMNLLFRDEAAFYAEYQNEPIELAAGELLSVEEICGRVSGFGHRVASQEADIVTAMIDVQKELLFYVVCAWRRDFTGWVLDYGAWPDQGTTNFRLAGARKTISKAFPGLSVEDGVYRALDALTKYLCGKTWKRDDGAELMIKKLLIDANWGMTRDAIYRFTRASGHRAVIDPCHGRYVGASSDPLNANTTSKSRGRDIGTHWRINKAKDGPVRHILFDTNWWKSFIHSRLASEPGTSGSLQLYQAPAHVHKTFANHLRAETPIRTEGRGRSVDEWKIRPERPDNHWFDCLVGCAVAASVEGANLSITKPRQPKAIAGSPKTLKRPTVEYL